MGIKINFLLIGAMKSGTTSLYKYLSAHPRIYMPAGKEVDFFSNDENFSRGFAWYANYFNRAGKEMVCGEASPHYMCFNFVPQRIYSFFPKVKLVALLRNPIDRAYSHYLMSGRREKESRAFGACVKELVQRGRVADSQIDIEREFVVFGEYGRILANYLQFFPGNQFKIVFSEELANQPKQTAQEIYRFLGVDSGFNSKIFTKNFHKRGERRFSGLEKALGRYKKYFRPFIPPVWRRNFRFWFDTQFNVRPVSYPPMAGRTRRFLQEYYQADVALLKKLFAVSPPWKDFQ